MAWGIYEVPLILFTVLRLVIQSHALGLDGDSPFALNIHGIKHLRSHFAFGQATALLDKTVCKGGFTVVNMGDDGKVSNVADVCHRRGILRLRGDREKLRQFYRFSMDLALDEIQSS